MFWRRILCDGSVAFVYICVNFTSVFSSSFFSFDSSFLVAFVVYTLLPSVPYCQSFSQFFTFSSVVYLQCSWLGRSCYLSVHVQYFFFSGRCCCSVLVWCANKNQLNRGEVHLESKYNPLVMILFGSHTRFGCVRAMFTEVVNLCNDLFRSIPTYV